MATSTPNYSFQKPTVSGDSGVWGGYLNANWASLDSLLGGDTVITGIDINSGTIDGATVGATTAASGAFTTLSASGTFTFGGVAITATGAEINYLDGVTSNIQTQLDASGAGSVTSVDISGGTTGLTTSGGPITGSGTITVAGTLAVANGGTGITSLGSGVATFLGTPSSANLASAVTDETGSGALVFGTSPTLSSPVLGTPVSGNLSSCTADGTNDVGTNNVAAVGTKTSAYTLAVGDVGKYVQVGSSGSIVVPDATFAEGDAVSIFNNTSGNITITCSITTAYIAGTDSDKSTMTLATRGVATVLFISGTICVVSGSVS